MIAAITIQPLWRKKLLLLISEGVGWAGWVVEADSTFMFAQLNESRNRESSLSPRSS